MQAFIVAQYGILGAGAGVPGGAQISFVAQHIGAVARAHQRFGCWRMRAAAPTQVPLAAAGRVAQSAGAGAGAGGKLRRFRHAIDGSVRLGVNLCPVMAAAWHS